MQPSACGEVILRIIIKLNVRRAGLIIQILKALDFRDRGFRQKCNLPDFVRGARVFTACTLCRWRPQRRHLSRPSNLSVHPWARQEQLIRQRVSGEVKENFVYPHTT